MKHRVFNEYVKGFIFLFLYWYRKPLYKMGFIHKVVMAVKFARLEIKGYMEG